MKLIFVFIVGSIVGICAMYFFTQSVTEEKAVSYYAIGMDSLKTDTDEAMLMFVYSSTLKPDWYAPHLGMAQCFELREDYTSAIKEYKRAIALREKSSAASYENEKITQTIDRLQKKIDIHNNRGHL